MVQASPVDHGKLDRTGNRLGDAAWILGLLIPLTLAGCASNPPTGSGGADPAALTGAVWRLDATSVDALATNVPQDVAVTIQFAQGEASGYSGCNSYGGSYQAKDDGSISFGEFRSTLMACEEPLSSLESAYMAALGKATTFSVGTTLILKGDGTLTFDKEAAPTPLALVGTPWTLTALGSDDTTSSAAPDHPGLLLFAAGGTVSGSTGCNSFHGTYTLSGDSLSFGPLATTRKACEQEVMTQEQAFVQAMEQVTGFSIEGPQLTLVDAGDSALLIFVGSST
jgi:heat shock protein HslJ